MNDFELRARLRKIGAENILTAQDLEELKAAERRVLELMSDGEWHTTDAICSAAGTDGRPARAGLRRMRSLRERFVVERRRHTASRDFDYRLRPAETLF